MTKYEGQLSANFPKFRFHNIHSPYSSFLSSGLPHGPVTQGFADTGDEAQNCFELQNQQTTVDIQGEKDKDLMPPKQRRLDPKEHQQSKNLHGYLCESSLLSRKFSLNLYTWGSYFYKNQKIKIPLLMFYVFT